VRWGVSLTIAVPMLALAPSACDDAIERDTPPRYYVPPDEEDAGGSVGPLADASIGPSTPGDASDDGPVVPAFDPAKLPLAGWFRAYAGSPWKGAASTGVSANQSLAQAEATIAPSAGEPLNGQATADFDGTDDRLDGPPVSSFHSTTAFSGWALVNVDAINTDDPNWPNNDHILATAGTGVLGIYLRDTGGVAIVGLGIFTTTNVTVTTTFTKGTWQLVQWRGDGINVSIRVNGSAWQSTPGGTLASLSAALDVGRNPAQNQWLDGRIAEIGLCTTVLTDADFEGIRSYVNAQYKLAL
jgi:hypothetical protein